MPSSFLKDPDAKLDYKFDWSEWLETGEKITSFSLIISTGLTEFSSSNDDDSVTVWLTGGTSGITYQVTCRITTDSNPTRIEDRTMTFLIIER
jgi:hypothetical protein